MFQTSLEAAPFDPEDLHGIRARINAETEGGYARFRRGLTADYRRVHRDIGLGYAALAVTLIATGASGPWAIPAGALLVGFFVAYLQLFIHEAAHHGLAADRVANDRIADWLICWQVGTNIASYRETHWQHHRALGGPDDTEVSYRNRLSAGFVLAMLSGVHALRVFLSRSSAGPKTVKPPGQRAAMLYGVAAHLTLLTTLVAVGWWPAAIAWTGGMAVCFPFFATMRQLLEHRPAAGDGGSHAVTRLFGDDIFSRLFGGAGFNRHMLHHLEPQTPYTRLADLEEFLMTTSARAELDARRSSYWRAFGELVRSDRRD